MKSPILKYLLVILLTSHFVQQALGQVTQDTASFPLNDIFIGPEISAIFPGGEYAMMQFIADNLKWPSMCQSITGIVYVSVKISKEGFMNDPELKRGLNRFIDAEALRVVSLFPREWEPARMGEVPVDSEYILPIKFMLN